MNQFNPYTTAFMGQAPNMLFPNYSSFYGPMQQMAGSGLLNAAAPLSQASGLSRLARTFQGFNYGTFLDGTQKTLTTINQIIPLVNQVTPMVKNASTMFRVASEVKKMSAEPPIDIPVTAVEQPVAAQAQAPEPIVRSSDQPTYFR